jgi:hypothetical protein
MGNNTPQENTFNIHHYFKVVDGFFEHAVMFDLYHDKFFEMQQLAASLDEESIAHVRSHPKYAEMEEKLEQIQRFIRKLS